MSGRYLTEKRINSPRCVECCFEPMATSEVAAILDCRHQFLKKKQKANKQGNDVSDKCFVVRIQSLYQSSIADPETKYCSIDKRTGIAIKVTMSVEFSRLCTSQTTRGSKPLVSSS